MTRHIPALLQLAAATVANRLVALTILVSQTTDYDPS